MTSINLFDKSPSITNVQNDKSIEQKSIEHNSNKNKSPIRLNLYDNKSIHSRSSSRKKISENKTGSIKSILR